MEEEMIRLYVGGLHSDVSPGDLQERFAPLGIVKSITLPSAKTGPGHRGFAYVDFVPASDASLRKLFSAYNGCKWRGGLLRIEKAKEHFSDRLSREWAAEADSLTKDLQLNEVEAVHQSALASARQKEVKRGNSGDVEFSGLNIFFPKLKKVRPMPLTGLGKHKRSFQRVEASPLQLLLTCACEESLRRGSCNCSNMNNGISSLKEVPSHENDDIAQAIEIERQRQLELLNRLFPSDSTSISLENQQVVELDNSDEGLVGSAEKTSSEQTLRVEQEPPTHAQQTTESLAGNEETGFDDDSTSAAVAMERAKQLELMNRLFPSDAPSTREPETKTVAEPEVVKVRKKKQKLNGSKSGADLVEPARDVLKGRITDNSVHLRNNLTGTNCGEQSSDPENVPIQHVGAEQELNVSESIPPLNSTDSLEGVSQMILNIGNDSVPETLAEGHELQELQSTAKVDTDTLSEDDMVLNVGDDSLSLATAEEQEKSELKSLSVRASELLEKVSEMTRHLTDNSLSFSNAKVRERQTSNNSQNVALDDGLEDSEMTLNLGNELVPLSTAEQQERALVRSFSAAKHYNWTRKDGSSDSEHQDGIEGSGGEEDHLDYSRDAEQGDEADDSESEEHTSGEQVDSDRSSDAEDNEIEEHPSEEQDDSLHNKDHSELISPTQMTNTKLAEGSLQRLNGESSVGKQSDESSKWAVLADMCQFRTESTVQSEEEKLERNSVPMATSTKSEDAPSIQVSALQVDDSKAPLQPQTDADNNGVKPDSSGQKLTRAAWKSLVGETGRVVFSLRQLTGSSLPQTPPLSQKPQSVEDTQTQVEPSVSSKKGAKLRLATVTAEKLNVGVTSPTEPKFEAANLPNAPVIPLVSRSDVCPFMKSENAEKEWLATKSELRLDYRAKQKHATRNVKKLWGKR